MLSRVLMRTAVVWPAELALITQHQQQAILGHLQADTAQVFHCQVEQGKAGPMADTTELRAISAGLARNAQTQLPYPASPIP